MESESTDSDLRALLEDVWGAGATSCEWGADGWERAGRLGFGEGSCVHPTACIYGDVRVGAHTWIGQFALLDGSGGLEIGDRCMICAAVQIYTHDSVKWCLSGGKAAPERTPVKIGDCCYIGSGSIVARGVTVGHHTLVGAGSIVTRDLPPYSMAVGHPCRVIGRVKVGEDGSVQLTHEPARTSPTLKRSG